MLVEEAAIPATHMTIANHPALSNPNSAKVLQTVHEAILINPIWQGPVLLGDDFVIALGKRETLGLLLFRMSVSRIP